MAPSPARYDVAALGELVIDLIPAGAADGEPLYAARPGGAPGNVAAGVARLGLRAAMLSKVGAEPFGDLVVAALAAAGVDTGAVRRAASERTALAVVALDSGGDRGFSLYRAGCADAAYGPGEVDADTVRGARILHVGSLSLGSPASAAAHRHAVALARAAGRLVSADPNFRPAVWPDEAAMLEAGREVVAGADIVKVSAEELAALAGTGDRAEAVRRLWHPGLRLLAVTAGAAGATLHAAGAMAAVPGFRVPVADTVGCGDAFMAALLAGLLAGRLDRLDEDALARLGRRAAAAGAIVATRSGAMTRMPEPAEIDRLLAAEEVP